MTISDEDRALLKRAGSREKSPDALDLDLATAVLHEQILRTPSNARFLQAARTAAVRPPATLPVDLVAVAPGAFHREHRHTGADGARALEIARQAGCAAEVIPTASFGAVDRNARTILDWLNARRGQRIALLSLSKGGAEVKRALSMPGAARAFGGVAAWISLSGMTQGTPLVAWLRRRPLRWWGVRLWLRWKGHDARALDDLRRHPPDSAAAAWPALPTRLRIVHVCGFPLRRHLAHPWAARGYERLAPLGPNDGGGILLADFAAPPGIVCPLWGVDHYLSPAWDILPLLRGIVTAALADGAPDADGAPVTE